jgi:hypothetical protein
MSDQDHPAESENPIADAIDAAEEIRDPLESPDVLERLAALKKDDRGAFESPRAQLKEAGCRVTALDEAIAEENGGMGRRGPVRCSVFSVSGARSGKTV